MSKEELIDILSNGSKDKRAYQKAYRTFRRKYPDDYQQWSTTFHELAKGKKEYWKQIRQLHQRRRMMQMKIDNPEKYQANLERVKLYNRRKREERINSPEYQEKLKAKHELAKEKHRIRKRELMRKKMADPVFRAKVRQRKRELRKIKKISKDVSTFQKIS